MRQIAPAATRASFHRARLTGLLCAVIEHNRIRILFHFLPGAFLRHLLFYLAPVVWHFLSELPLIAVLNELRQRHLPGLLLVICHTSQLLRIHAEFPRHLHVRVRQMIALPRLNPRPELLRNEFCFRHRLRDAVKAHNAPRERRRHRAYHEERTKLRPCPMDCKSRFSAVSCRGAEGLGELWGSRGLFCGDDGEVSGAQGPVDRERLSPGYGLRIVAL